MVFLTCVCRPVPARSPSGCLEGSRGEALGQIGEEGLAEPGGGSRRSEGQEDGDEGRLPGREVARGGVFGDEEEFIPGTKRSCAKAQRYGCV